MTKDLMAIYAGILLAFIGLLMITSWLRRRKKQELLFEPPLEALEFFGELLLQTNAFYVATTFANNSLERINAYGLGFRGKCQVLIFSEGVLILRDGEVPLAIDRADIFNVGSTQAVIDKAVESGGIISVDWNHDESQLSTHLRIVETLEREKFLNTVSKVTLREATK